MVNELELEWNGKNVGGFNSLMAYAELNAEGKSGSLEDDRVMVEDM